MSPPLESEFQKKVIAIAHMRGWWCEKIESKSGRGITDLLAIRNGVHLLVECKREGEDLRKQQDLRARELRKYGATVLKCDTLGDARVIFQ